VDSSRITFEVGPSDQVVPRLEAPEYDLFLIDGAHGWPQAIIDWYYGGSLLREGGILVLDDLQLKQVTLGLLDYLDADPRWEQVARQRKWVAYRRRSTGSLYDEWRSQPFLGKPWRTRVNERLPERVKPIIRKVVRSLRRS
jgi:predicted O-methyltransferase YrrM